MRFLRVELQPGAGYRDLSAPAHLVLTGTADVGATYGDCRLRPSPDFGRHFLVAVHRGPCPTGGHTIRINDIEQHGDEVTVTIARRDPRPGEPVTMMITHPRDCVAVERSALICRGRLHFHFVDERGKKLSQVTAHID